jgi:thiol:disulfide interchange protein DsbD
MHERSKVSQKAFLFGLLLIGLLSTHSQAQVGLDIHLVPEVTAIIPGQSFRVGLFLRHEKGWHTYYQQPGIVGVPTSIVWSLPEGFKAGPLEYPEPEVTHMFQIKAQGYERDVLLQTTLQAPDNLKAGQQITLEGKATWMCCGKTCHPGSKQLSLVLPVSAESTLNAQWHPVFEKERSTFVKTSSAWQTSATEKGLTVTLTLKPVDPTARPFDLKELPPSVVFFTEDGWINSDQSQIATYQVDGSLTLTLTRAEFFINKNIPKNLFGIVQRKGGWLKGSSLRSLKISPLLFR